MTSVHFPFALHFDHEPTEEEILKVSKETYGDNDSIRYLVHKAKQRDNGEWVAIVSKFTSDNGFTTKVFPFALYFDAEPTEDMIFQKAKDTYGKPDNVDYRITHPSEKIGDQYVVQLNKITY